MSPEAGRARLRELFSAKTGRHFDVDFARGDEVVSRPAPHRVAANDADTWLALALAGLGLLQAPVGAAVRAHLERGELVRVLDWASEALPMFVLYPAGRHLPARVRVFVDGLALVHEEECARSAAFVERA